MTEKMYNDFVTNVLPKIEEGLMITKDYFQDLFGRYIQYLIIRDAALTAGFALIAVIALAFLILFLRWAKHKDKTRDDEEAILGITLVGIAIFSGAVLFTALSADNLIKDIYVPEIRVYEELSDHLK